jgi:uncharacterized membrane protein YjjP (DUF1212 family)
MKAPDESHKSSEYIKVIVWLGLMASSVLILSQEELHDLIILGVAGWVIGLWITISEFTKNK